MNHADTPIRAILVENHPIVRDVIRMVPEKMDAVEILAEAGDGRDRLRSEEQQSVGRQFRVGLGLQPPSCEEAGPHSLVHPPGSCIDRALAVCHQRLDMRRVLGFFIKVCLALDATAQASLPYEFFR